jgi:hypothetical protein
VGREQHDPHQLSRQTMQVERTLEGYVAASAPPRWMERLVLIDAGVAREREQLRRAHQRARQAAAGDADAFARTWRETVGAWSFDEELNELIRIHNEWFPVERRLPVDPRTRDYVLVAGRPYRRPVLDAEWALSEFPAGRSATA